MTKAIYKSGKQIANSINNMDIIKQSYLLYDTKL